jgi:hypothetical protein
MICEILRVKNIDISRLESGLRTSTPDRRLSRLLELAEVSAAETSSEEALDEDFVRTGFCVTIAVSVSDDPVEESSDCRDSSLGDWEEDEESESAEVRNLADRRGG